MHDNVSTASSRTQQQSLKKQQQTFASTPEDLAQHCERAERQGRDWKCTCPICGKHSLSIARGHKFSILIWCWFCENAGLNDGHTEQRTHFINEGLLDPEEQPTKFNRREYQAYCEKQRAKARALWDHPFVEPVTAKRDAGRYLTARGLVSFIEHPALRCIAGALIARVWHVNYGLSAIQYTWLLPYGSDRDRAQGRITKGVLKGGGVWIGAPQADEPVVVAEGLETLLSALIVLDLKCGVACLGTNFKDLVLPRNVGRVIIAADNDDSGQGASTHTAHLWQERGLKVWVFTPANEGQDFNDVLRGL